MSYQLNFNKKPQKETTDEKYIVEEYNGNFKVMIVPKLIMISLWVLMIVFFYFPLRHNVGNKYIYGFILSFPFIVIIYELLLNKNELFSDKSYLPIRWEECFERVDNNEHIQGIWDYKCGADQIKYLQNILKTIQENFFYLNYALFLLILIYTNISENLAKYSITNHKIVFICLALILGTIGILPSSFSDGYVNSLMFTMAFATLLNMNMSAFLVVLYSLMK